MFRTGLLVSTAMTAVTLLLSGAPEAYAQTDMHTASRDPNTRFLCTYGHLNVSQWFSGGGISYSGWTHVAVPITGHGQTVTRLRVVEGESPRTYYPSFIAGIYSNTASGFPGKPIAVGTGSISSSSSSCGKVTISIPATKLKRQTKYWVEQTVPWEKSFSSTFYWYADPKTKRRAYVQSHRWQYSSSRGSSSYTSPWTKQKMGPYLKLR